MASTEFTIRFKNKISKVGKLGLIPFETSNAIEKSELPESKVHIPLSSISSSHLRAVKIDRSVLSQSKSPISDHYTTEKLLGNLIFPGINRTPMRSGKAMSRSKSPVMIRNCTELQNKSHVETIRSNIKLPRINSGMQKFKERIYPKMKSLYNNYQN